MNKPTDMDASKPNKSAGQEQGEICLKSDDISCDALIDIFTEALMQASNHKKWHGAPFEKIKMRSNNHVGKVGHVFVEELCNRLRLSIDHPKDKNGKQLRIPNIPQQLIIKGSKRYNYRFFQFKTVDQQLGKSKDRRSGRHEVNLTIGMVVDKEGHCIVLEAMPGVIIRTYYTTVHSLRLNLDLFEINLEEVG